MFYDVNYQPIAENDIDKVPAIDKINYVRRDSPSNETLEPRPER
jgi:hypothetical protein